MQIFDLNWPDSDGKFSMLGQLQEEFINSQGGFPRNKVLPIDKGAPANMAQRNPNPNATVADFIPPQLRPSADRARPLT